MVDPEAMGMGSMNCEERGARYHIVYEASFVVVRVNDFLWDGEIPTMYAVTRPKVTITGVNSLFCVVRINGVIGVISTQLRRLPPIIAAKHRLSAGVVSLLVSFSKLIRGVQKFGLIRLDRVIRIE